MQEKINKKVIILTVQKAPNFGASLQAYALYKYISDIGFDTQILDLLRPIHKGYKAEKGFCSFKYLDEPWIEKVKRVLVRPVKTEIKRYFGKDYAYNFKQDHKIELAKRMQRFLEFDSMVSYTKPYTIKELYKKPPIADFYITGSDQLWNPTQPYPLEPFFLTFSQGVGKRISYATSIGLSKLSDFVKHKFKQWLVGYDALSLREESAVEIIQKLTDLQVEKCCDPTFLIGREEWDALADKRLVEAPYIFIFTLAHSKALYEYACKLRKKTGLKLVVLTDPTPSKETEKEIRIVDAGPRQWLSLIKHAEVVLTNSFHGSAFSVIFHKPVRTIIQNNRGTRIMNLFKDLGMESCLLENVEMDCPEIPVIDYEAVNLRFTTMRKKGIDYLEKSLMKD